MSKNIIIAKDGEDMTFRGVDTLRTSAVGGGSVDWMPEDETQTGTIDIRANGTYRAEDKGLYAFSRATVNVPPNQVTGRGSDGNDYHVTVDEDGYLVETKIPTSIKITTPPTYTGPYGDGAIIGFDGLVVTAYDADGESMGVIPTSELVFPVTIARYDPDAEMGEYATSDLCQTPIPCADTLTYTSNLGYHIERYFSVGSGKMTGYGTSRDGHFIHASDTSTAVVKERGYTGEDHMFENYTHNGKTVYYGRLGTASYSSDMKPTMGPTSYALPEYIAWTMIYGDVETVGGVPIPVQWPRPGDGRILADTFDIEVVDVSPSEN